ncbi:MAG: hypothetical protein R3232_11415 [Clostridia bacterium]|nr:hypothetical protein [Clostridia bacterium]
MSAEIVKMINEYEFLVSRMYTTCSEKFPDLSEFWMGLAREEVRHADTIKEIMAEVDGMSVKLNQKRFNARPIEISMDHVNGIIGRLEFGDIDLLGILSLALDIEQSVIESKYYEIFTGRSRSFNDRMKEVRDESRNHARIIREMKQRVMLENNAGEENE